MYVSVFSSSQVAPLPFMAEDFPIGECTLYGCGDNASEQVPKHSSFFVALLGKGLG